MTLPKGQAYCLTCLGARSFASDGMDTLPAGQVNVRIGTCLTCGDRMVRILPTEYGYVIPEALPVPTRATYSGEGRWSYGEGRYVTANGTQALHKIEKISALLNKITDSVDLQGSENGRARWGAIVAAKASADHFDAIVNKIILEGFRFSPVMWSPNGDRDGYSNGGWTIGNGHHRIVAAILLGLEYLPVVVSLGNDYMRCEDSSDDENAPIERDYGAGRYVWSVIRDYLPAQGARGQGARECAGCNMGCECCHNASCAQGARAASVLPATGTETRKARERAGIINRAQCAAGDAVYAMLQARRVDQGRMREQAAEMRAEIERMIEEANKIENDAIKIDSEIDVLWQMYDAAAKITPRN